MGTKWNYRVVAVVNEDNNKDSDAISDDPQENVEEFVIVRVYYDEHTDKIVGTSDVEGAAFRADTLDNLRIENHSIMGALESPVLQGKHLPGSSDYEDPEEGNDNAPGANASFWSSGKAKPTKEGNSDGMEPAETFDGTPEAPHADPDNPDFSKATATESDDREVFGVAAAPGPEETDHVTDGDDGDDDLDSMTIEDIKSKHSDVDFTGVTRKDDVIAAVRDSKK